MSFHNSSVGPKPSLARRENYFDGRDTLITAITGFHCDPDPKFRHHIKFERMSTLVIEGYLTQAKLEYALHQIVGKNCWQGREVRLPIGRRRWDMS